MGACCCCCRSANVRAVSPEEDEIDTSLVTFPNNDATKNKTPTPVPNKDFSKNKAPTPIPEKHPLKNKTREPAPENDTSKKQTTTATCGEDYSAIKRYRKIGITAINPVRLINGYEKESLLSLETALEPVNDKIDDLSEHIQEAKRKCHYPSEHKLTHDESAAIYIYSMKWKKRCVHNQLNSTWKLNDRSAFKPWLKYLRLLKSGLNKLPNAGTKVWQGTGYNKTLKKKLDSKSSPLYTKMGSCSSSPNEIKDYLEKNGHNRMILVGYDSINGKDVTGYTASKSNEVMVWPGVKLGSAVTNSLDHHGSLVANISGRNCDALEREDVTNTLIVKHFECPKRSCGYRCLGNHKEDHCYGFRTITHTYHHHCTPSQPCDVCGKNPAILYRCHRCGGCYCSNCCF